MINIVATLKDVEWHKKGPAEPELVQKLVGDAVEGLPESYLAFLLYSNGGEGKLGINPGWFQIWSTEDVVKLNKGFSVNKFIPGYFGFGSNGGGELLAFDMTDGKPWKIVMIPFIPMEAELAITIANDFEDFIQAIGHELK